MKTIDPKIGAYFKNSGKTYLSAKLVIGCNECCFNKYLHSQRYCSAPENLNCEGRIFKDVTGMTDAMGVELIDTPKKEKTSIWPLVVFLVAFWALVIILIIK